MKRMVQNFDLVVAGGGLAGLCAAVAAARHGLKVCLVHDRPVLGGNASSEVRVTVHGVACHHPYGRETGIVHEILESERAANHETINENGWVNSVLDLAMYDLAQRTAGLTLHLNTPVLDVIMEAGSPAAVAPQSAPGYWERPACASSRRLVALVARTLNAETDLELRAPFFVDATGDALVSDRAGCAWRVGAESHAETGEVHAPERASTDTMGSSIHIRCRDMGREVPFTPPAWAMRYEDPAFFYDQGRVPGDPRGGFWWLEIGVPWHTIHDNETIRHELTRHALGVWDWMKNRDPKTIDRCRNYALDFIGQVPGKRESRRVVGHHWLNENELQALTVFPDEVAYGGWFVDLHTPGGLLAASSEPANTEGLKSDSEYQGKSYVGPYGIPLRCLMARDVDNLFLAGRCLSATHAALGSVRVMGTTALMGQAVGTAAAVALARGLDLAAVAADAAAAGPAIREVQQRLLRDGCFLPNVSNTDAADLAQRAQVAASSCARVYGCAPEERVEEAGLFRWGGLAIGLEAEPGQMVACVGGRIDRVALCLDVPGSAPVAVPVRLVRCRDLWDYRRDGDGILATGVLSVAPGEGQWAWWNVGLTGVPDGYVRLQPAAVPGVIWRQCYQRMPAHPSTRRLSPTRVRGQHSTNAFRVEPAQSAWSPRNVLSGCTRPRHGTESWRSDPGQGLPQWIELAWDGTQRITRVELTFPGQLRQEVHAEPPFHRAPQTARDYSIEVDAGDGILREVLRVTGNWNRRRVHELPCAVDVRRLRLVILATNGDPAAALAEMRCY